MICHGRVETEEVVMSPGSGVWGTILGVCYHTAILSYLATVAGVRLAVFPHHVLICSGFQIANYVWDARTGYRKETVFATEEGRNLLTHQQV